MRAFALLLCLVLSTVSWAQPAGVDTTPPQIVSPPILTPNANPAAPLAARIALETDEPTRVVLILDDGVQARRVLAERQFRTQHQVAVLGVHPATSYTIQVIVSDAAGNRANAGGPLLWTTKPLPVGFPPLRVTTSSPNLMEPGYTLFNTNFSSPTIAGRGNFIVILDEAGRVVWLFQSRVGNNYEAVRLRNGNFMIIGSGLGAKTAEEVDLFGNIVHVWAAVGTGIPLPPGAIPVATDTFHHEFQELPEDEDGDFLALSTEMRVLPNYPTSEVDPTQTAPTGNVIGDVIVEFTRNGNIVRETKLLDILDPYRVVYNSLAGFFNDAYGVTTLDWSHGNAVVLDRADNSYIVSLRHQDAVVKIRRDTNEIVWILGAHDRWNAPWNAKLLTPLGTQFEWQFHQHSPHIAPWAPATNLTLFDNGNYRVIPPATPPPPSAWYSRAVEYRIDAANLTVEQMWAYGGLFDTTNPWFFSGFIGDADALANMGNVLVCDGAKNVPGQNKTYSRIVEVQRTNPAVPVFEVIVNDPTQASPSPYNWNTYRSQRIRSVYPD